ncbi:MAG TPA: thiamine pyrophosphate-dependent enzyme [Patescibacteria group bacterium]
MPTINDLATPHLPTWCPGCGNFGIWAAFKNAAVQKGWDNTNSVITAGIGCHGHIVNFVKINSFEGLHGRALPVASGIKLVNPRLNVFTFVGDGDCLSEGGNHFIHACRRNHNITVILHNNDIYGLTTGQCSPTSPNGFVTTSTPDGNPDQPFNVLQLALSAGATFVARAYSGDINSLTDVLIQANDHQGISIVEVLQPCVTFNKVCTHTYFRDNVRPLPQDYNKTDFSAAFAAAQFSPDGPISVGVLYQVQKTTAESGFIQFSAESLANIVHEKRDLSSVLKKYY